MTEEAFQNAMETHLNMVFRIALNYFGNRSDAEDAAQEAMLRLWKSCPNLTGDQLKFWLIRTTVNVCHSGYRSMRRQREIICEEAVSFSVPEQREIYDEVMELPPKYRVPLYLHYFEGYSCDEVGKLMRLNPSTVRTRIARARTMLKKIILEDA